MGNCAAPQITRNGGLNMTAHHHNWSSSSPPATLKLIHMDGRLEEFTQTIKASHLLSRNPNCFLCNSESMFIDSAVLQIHGEEDLYLGQLYFLLPLSMSRAPLSLRELCLLAIKASTVLEIGSEFEEREGWSFVSGKSSETVSRSNGNDTTRLELGQSSRRIEL